MTEPLKDGDTVIVVRDLLMPPADRCYGGMVGTPATLKALHPAAFGGFFGPLWGVKERLTCPHCKGVGRLFLPGELQKLRGPEASTDTPRQVETDSEACA